MNIVSDPRVMQREAEKLRLAGKRLAVVPTMGALHEGHCALLREARKRADCVIVTVFVNPAQFGEGEDFARYPRDLPADTARAAEAGADLLFSPDAAAMYGDGYQTFVTVEQVAKPLEGALRPIHFRGVATVVAKLFHLTKPHVAVFGQKDAQQVVVISRMVKDLDFDCELIIVPTVRESDGLARSSRNVYLTPAQRKEAPVLYASLQEAADAVGNGERSAKPLTAAIRAAITSRTSGSIDYVSVADGDTLRELATLEHGQHILVSLAVKFGTTRLIDNIPLTVA